MSATGESQASKARFNIRAAMPLILSQLFILWLVFDRQTSYFQVALMNALEIWLVLLISALFFSRSARIAAGRLGDLLSATAILLLLLVFVLLAAATGSTDVLGGAVALINESISRPDRLLQGLAYVGIMFALSLIAALTSGNARLWWYTNMVQSAATVYVALVIGAFAGALLAASPYPPLASAVIWTLLFFSARMLFVYLLQTRMTPQELAAFYAKYEAGES